MSGRTAVSAKWRFESGHARYFIKPPFCLLFRIKEFDGILIGAGHTSQSLFGSSSSVSIPKGKMALNPVQNVLLPHTVHMRLCCNSVSGTHRLLARNTSVYEFEAYKWVQEANLRYCLISTTKAARPGVMEGTSLLCAIFSAFGASCGIRPRITASFSLFLSVTVTPRPATVAGRCRCPGAAG